MFSVVIPLYNKEKSINSTIESVLNQTFYDFEIIVVNDGSTDKSVEQVKKFDDERIRIVHKQNGGVSSARNKGIKNAKHEWVAFLDGDDLWLDIHLEELNNIIIQFEEASVITTNWIYDYEENEYNSTSEYYTIDNYFKESIINKEVAWTSVVAVKKKCFTEVGLFNENLTHGEDLLMWVKLANNFTYAKTSIVTAIRRTEAENRAMNNVKKINHGFIKALKKEFGSKQDRYKWQYLKRKIKWELNYSIKRVEISESLKFISEYRNVLSSTEIIKYSVYMIVMFPLLYFKKRWGN